MGWRQIINKRPPQPDHYRAPAGSTALYFFAKILWQHWELALAENITSAATILAVFLGVERKYVDYELIYPSWPYNLPPTLKIITRNFPKENPKFPKLEIEIVSYLQKYIFLAIFSSPRERSSFTIINNPEKLCASPTATATFYSPKINILKYQIRQRWKTKFSIFRCSMCGWWPLEALVAKTFIKTASSQPALSWRQHFQHF